MSGIKISAPGFKIFPITRFHGGLVDNPVREYECSVLQNLWLREDGKLIGRGLTYPLTGNLPASSSTGLAKLFDLQNTFGSAVGLMTFQGMYHINLSSAAVTGVISRGTTAGSLVAGTNGQSVNAKQMIFASILDSSLGIYQWNGTTGAGNSSNIKSFGAGALMYDEGILFAVGYDTQTTYKSNRIYYSSSLDPTTWPAANNTDITFGDYGGIIDLGVFQSQKYIVCDHGVGRMIGVSGNYVIVPGQQIGDTLMAGTLSIIGSRAMVVGTHGVYSLENLTKNLAVGVYNTYAPDMTVTSTISGATLTIGKAALSAQGLGYYIVQDNLTDVLVYNLPFQHWSLFTFPVTAIRSVAPIMWTGGAVNQPYRGTLSTEKIKTSVMAYATTALAPNGAVFHVLIPATKFSGYNNKDYVDTSLTESTATDYTTKYQSAPLDFNAPDVEKHLRDIQVELSGTSVTILIEGQTKSDIQANTWTTLKQWTSQTLPFVGHLPSHGPVLRVRVTVQGVGDLVIESLYLSWKPARWRTA